VRFRIYYGDGTTYSGDPYLAPPTGVQIINEFDPDQGRIKVHSHDWYVWDGDLGQWLGVTLDALIAYMRRNGPRKVLFGETIRTQAFYDCVEKAMNDPDFPDSLVKTVVMDKLREMLP